MARDIATMLKSKPMGVHCQCMSWTRYSWLMPLESSSTQTVDCHEDMDKYTSHVNKFCHLLETFVDDFMNIAQTADEEQLWHIALSSLASCHPLRVTTTTNNRS
jgi:hypothetical protein